MSDITDLLVELCPSYAKKRGGVVNDVLQKREVAITSEDKAKDLVKAGGEYIDDAWIAYKVFRKLGSVTLGAINAFGNDFPNPAAARYAAEVKNGQAFDDVIARVRAWFKKMRADALAAIVAQTPGMGLTHAFNQAEHTSTLTNNQTLCEVQGNMDVGLLVGTRETCDKGHIFAFFRSKGAWTLFDSNYGEFELKTSGPADMGAKWLEIYFTQGFRTVEVAAMVRPEAK